MTILKYHPGKPHHPIQQYRHFFIALLVILFLGACTIIFLQLLPEAFYDSHSNGHQKISLENLENAPVVSLSKDDPSALKTRSDCHYFNCFDVYRCGRLDTNKMTVYVYPLVKFVDEHDIPITNPISKEFHDILQTILESEFYTPDPENACIFVPSIDLLNQNHLRLHETSQVLQTLRYWNGGTNHILFNMLPGGVPDYSAVVEVNRGSAMVAGGGVSTWTYRRGFDISIPVYSPLVEEANLPKKSADSPRRRLVVSTQFNIHSEYRQDFLSLADEHPEFLVLDLCPGDEGTNYSHRCQGDEVFPYPEVLQDSTFCLVVRGARLGQVALLEAMMTGCIPVMIADTYVMPFSEVLEWKKAAIFIFEDDIPDLMHLLKSVSDEHIIELRQQVMWLYQHYFSSMKAITLTCLQILNDRIFPHAAKSYEDWNVPSSSPAAKNPLFLPLTAPRAQGFTVVILTYDRVESLFQVIQKVVKAPSLAKVLVVWNNQKKPPPQPSVWPKINKPLKVVQTRENKLSNRFYPYEEIETEAILAIDDDIIMLTADELEFGYEVWREFPDRIVGFPSRTHVWDNSSARWKYESEWTSDISMVLTGAAFYHKYWSYLYSTSMPGNMKTWVDGHMNCEDIAMNFLVANITGKAPIKVTPRKKFKCPECTNVEMLSADLSHMIERSECINRFTKIYGNMPLKTVEFRADPVLYKDSFPEKLKRFNDIGSL